MLQRRERDPDSIGFFNLARGCGICIVIAGHSLIYYYPIAYHEGIFGNLFTNIGAGFMAMFFIISGYGFYPQKPKKCIRTQSKLLLKPYVITVCLILLAKLGLALLRWRSFWEFGGQYIFSYLLAVNEGWEGTILGLEVNHVAMFWFFWSLWGGWILYNFIARLRSKRLRITLAAACVVLGWSLTLISRVWVYVIPNMLVVVGFLAIGHWMRETGWLMKPRLTALEYTVLLIPALITLAFGWIDMYSYTWRLGLVDILGSACLGILFCRFFAWVSTFRIENKITEALNAIGFHTLWIFCIHAFEEKVFPWYRLGILFSERKYIAVILCVLLRCVVIWIGIKLIEWVKRMWKQIKRKGKRSRIAIE